MRLTDETIEQIKKDKTLFIDIQKALNTTESTVYRHLSKNTARLIGMDILNILTERLNKPLDQIIIS